MPGSITASAVAVVLLLLVGVGPWAASAQSAQGRCLLAGNGLSQGQCCDLDSFCNIYWVNPWWATMQRYNTPNMECCQCQFGCAENRETCSGSIDTTSATCRDFNRASSEVGSNSEAGKDDNDTPDDFGSSIGGGSSECQAASIGGSCRRRRRQAGGSTTGLVQAPESEVLEAAVRMYMQAANGAIDISDFDTGSSIARRCKAGIVL